jgi:D-alanyl-lipoteichoic acid acyltransferase DltB (MBOAT superfamily)
VNPTTNVLSPAVGNQPAVRQATSWPIVSRHLLLLSQLVLAAVVVYLYRIENPAFQRLFILTTAGFAINLAVPMAYRLRFFVLLSFAGIVTVFGLRDGAWLVAAGLVLIGLCHLPVAFMWRVIALLVAGALLAVSRGGLVEAPWSAAVWPILGSMFMFRLVLYMMALRSPQADRSLWGALAYFFMLPNLVFPLFPVIDYQTFRRTHYDKNEIGIYEQGLLWISRGLVHLVLYRFVYHSVLNDPVDVVALGDLVQFMLGTFLLYLRVSGQFHLIVGILHLFGFRLPETHKLYYLAHSFTELWRRINIYWTDFMMKAVFYPTYFQVKRLGPSAALVIATSAVFFTTWILHSYQWFWLRGGFPITMQDALFWGFLGALVIMGALKELKAVKKTKRRTAGWSWRLGLQAATTFTAFCFLWSLWSTESVMQWVWMLGAAANVDVKGIVLIAVTFGTLVFLGGRDYDAPRPARPAWLQLTLSPAGRTAGALAALLIVGQPAVHARVPQNVAAGLQSMQTTGLNARDAALQHRGYYEQLEVRGALNDQVANAVRRNDERWDNLASVGMLRERRDMLQRDLYPSKSVLWNGNTFSTNRWGMRDRDYAQEKPADTLRIALLGPSHVMGNGVPDGATFEALVEERLNRDLRHDRYRNVEILNFGVDGYSLAQQVAILEDRVLSFSPDVVIVTHYQRNRQMTERYLQRIAWGNVAVPYEPLHALLGRAGFTDMDRGGTPVPFSSGRRIAKWAGIQPRMPVGEAAARARWIADDVIDWGFGRIAEVTQGRGIQAVVLGLNAVIDDVPAQIPHLEAIRAARLPVIDLFDVFPEAERPALRVAPWDDHPNAAGHRLIAERLYDQLLPLLNSGVLAPRQSRETTTTTDRRF